MSLNNALTHGKLQRCQTLRGDMQITAETMQTYKIWHITMLTARLYLKSSLFHKMKCPSWTRVKRQKRSSGQAENGKGAKNTHFRESFVRKESCRPVTTFELAVIQWIYLFQKSTVSCQCHYMQWNKDIFSHQETNLWLFVSLRGISPF